MLLLAVTVSLWFILDTGGAVAQTVDDHGDTSVEATPLPLGSSAAGRINPGSDRDVFKLDLSGASGPTDVWIHTTGGLDTVGGLYDGYGNLLALNDDSRIEGRETNFHLRGILSPAVYYVLVVSYLTETGNYTLHAEAVTDPSSAASTARRLHLDSPAPGTIYTATDVDYFRLDLTESKHLILYARGLIRAPIDGHVFDRRGREIPVNVYPHVVTNPINPNSPTIYGFRIEDDFGPGAYYIRVTTPDRAAYRPAYYTIHALEDTVYSDFIEDCEARTRSLNDPQISDPLYGCQWHLNNRDGEDVNVEAVWEDGVKGEGVNVAVVDNGMDSTHEDLTDNVDASRNHDYTGAGDIHHPFAHHGTNVAGLIAARDNGVGVRGVAPRATIYGYNLLVDTTDINEADAMTRNGVVTAVSNNSWGPPDTPRLEHAHSFWEEAVKTGVTTGYDGKGTFYAWAAGNGHMEGDNSNLEEYSNYYAVTAVCGVNDLDTRSDFSEMGANLWVCAPSNDTNRDERRGIVTIENSDRYVDDFGGTSAATPVVSGAAALMRSANPDLTWRDLKLILAASARKNDAENPGWEDGARKYGSDSAADRYHFNHEYGFGVVDARAAVDLAKGWTNAPPLQSSTAESSGLNLQVPDAPDTDDPTTVTLTLDTAIGFTEFVEVTVSFQHDSFRDLDIELVSPSGAVSKLVESFDTFFYSSNLVPLLGEFRFGSARHLGEDPNGVWQLRVTDRIQFVDGTLDSWSVTVYGHEPTPYPPTVDSITAGVESLTVAWTAPSQAAGLAVTSYDMRYIEADADGTVDSNWTVVNNVWTAAAGGDLEYTITGLTGGAQYDVQVRVVNARGAGGWSAIASGTPGVDLLSVYDRDNNGVIDRDEAIQAINDYFNDLISRDQAIEVINLYFLS